MKKMIKDHSFTYKFVKTFYDRTVEIKVDNETGIEYLVRRCSVCGQEAENCYRGGDKLFCSMECALRDAKESLSC